MIPLPDPLKVLPASGPINAVVTVPGSKSITNRALLVSALAKGASRISGALFSDDTHYMSAALRQAGVGIDADADRCEFVVTGRGGPPLPVQDRLVLGNAGTAMRFLTSYFTLGEGTYVLDGVPRMRERPIQDLLDALNSLGADVQSEMGTGCPPVVIHGRRITGGCVTMPGQVSSQFVSSLLLSAPYFREGLDLHIAGVLSHRPYLDLTGDVMQAFGVSVENDGCRRFVVPPGTYAGREYAVEPDVSSASYFLAAAALTGGQVMVPHLSRASRQGDIEFVRLLERLGCEASDSPQGLVLRGPSRLDGGLDVDMNSCSDIALTLAAIAPFCAAPTHIRNIGHVRFQETDRIHAMVTELRRAGVTVEERDDGFSIYPSEPRATTFETYDDHRMAMSLALIGLRTPGIAIRNPGCVAKTVPSFWKLLSEVTATARSGSSSVPPAGIQ